MRFALFIVTLFFATSFSSFAMDPNLRALEIAKKSPRVQKVHSDLLKIVKSMKPSDDGFVTKNVLDDTLSLLGDPSKPPFIFQVSKDKNQEEIIQKLNEALPQEKRVSKNFTPAEWAKNNFQIFPPWNPMPITAATGSGWNGHHVCPGGLVTHLYTTALTNLNFLNTYEKAFQYKFKQSEKDLVVLSAIWHDAAKTWTLKWNDDGTLTSKEGQIAWTGSHHVLSAAEALTRGFPKQLVMAIAASHEPANEAGDSFKEVLNYLVAAAVIANKPLDDVGITGSKGDYKLESKPTIFMIIQNLGDSDWVLISQALVSIRPKIEEQVRELKLAKNEEDINWFVDQVLTSHGELVPYHLWNSGGDAALQKYVSKNF